MGSVLSGCSSLRFFLVAVPVLVGLIEPGEGFFSSVVWTACACATNFYMYSVYDQVDLEDEDSTLLSRHRLEHVVVQSLTVGQLVLTIAYKSLLRKRGQEQKYVLQLQASKESAEAAARLKQEFLATMTHEIRTPLHGLLGIAAVIASSTLTEEQSQNLKLLRQCGDVLLELVNSVLDLSKIESGLLTLENSSFDVSVVLQKVHDVLDGMATAKGIKLKTFIHSQVPKNIKADFGKLLQVVLNLASNAVKFTPRGEVEILVETSPSKSAEIEDHTQSYAGTRLRKKIQQRSFSEVFPGNMAHKEPDKWLLFSICDTGPGVPLSMQKKIFDPFVQGKEGEFHTQKGNGLGLTISRKLVEHMGGEIGVQSNSKSGSVFWFTIPLLYEQEEFCLAQHTFSLQRQRSFSAPKSVPPSNIQILLTDDSNLNVTIALKFLEALGYRNVDVATNGRIALDKMTHFFSQERNENTINIILMDLFMNEMNGYDSTQAIRQLESTAHKNVPDLKPRKQVYIIGVTANCAGNERSRCLEIGMNDFLSKPFNRQQLKDILDKAVSILTN
eukprot:TRINITY_DN780_c0_g1_i1.p1 TRINITY_DN780_c0_g1~~TRINITY_DN780_c0_g1_i1.p1  ORF type:complete len:557 (-),score=81.47 TRINITY_DN780_c0_g1_i1:177-1847(-)